MEEKSKKDSWLKPSQVARVLNMSARNVRNLCAEGKLPCIKIGARWRINPDYLEWLEERPEGEE